jgi:TonB family protein
MLQSTTTRGATTTWVSAIYEDKQRRRLLIAIVLLLAAITAVLIRNYESGLANNNDATAAADSQQPAYAPSTAGPAPVVAAAEVPAPVATKNFAKATYSHRPSSHTRTWGPATAVSQQVRTPAEAQPHPQSSSYPLLTQATAVRGSVLLQALIGADGTVGEMRVISGPTILVSAARQAVQQWHFKPYLVNGKAVETYARVTVNFSIDVSNTEARYHVSSVTSAGAL